MVHPFYKTLLIISTCVLISACASKPRLTMQEAGHQYCTTNKTMVEQDGVIKEIKVTECNDDNVKKLMPPKMGLGKNCREHWYNIRLNGRMVKQKGYACQFKGDSYETTKWYIVKSPY
jgi:hypothetical protein|tara:strand:+ start:3539 stop:3892 length:354 start_codon:yes stop_codon:yes gene_type:complete